MRDLLRQRQAHITTALRIYKDEARLKLANNIFEYLKSEPVSRWSSLVSRSAQKKNPSWSCCPGCDSAERGSIPPSGNSTTSGPVSSPSDHSRCCPYCPTPCPTIRGLVKHLQKCLETPSSARAKSLDASRKECLYNCGYDKSNYNKHEEYVHFLCACQKVGTQRSCEPDCPRIELDPVEYFSSEPSKVAGPSLQDIITAGMDRLPSSAFRALCIMPDDALVVVIRTGLLQSKHSKTSKFGTIAKKEKLPN